MGFRDANSEFERRNIAVVGASADDLETQRAFADKNGFPFPLIADPEKQIIEAYGVWGERTRPDGTTTIGIRRTTFVIDPEGKISRVYHSVTPEGHGMAVLKDLQEIS